MKIIKQLKFIMPALLGFLCNAIAFSQMALAQTYTTGYRYNIARQVTGEISSDPDGAGPLGYLATRNTYNAQGLLVKIEAGELSAWQAESVAPASWTGFTVFKEQVLVYDDWGRKLQETSYSGGVAYTLTQYSYNRATRVKCTAIRMNPTTYGSLPSSACTLGVEGSFGPDRITRTTVNGRGLVTKIQKAFGTLLQQDYAIYTYGIYGNQASATDANGNFTSMVYDGFGRLSTQYFPSKTLVGQFDSADYESYQYDANSNRIYVRKRDGQVITYDYDALNRVTKKNVPGTVDDVYYGYDLRGLQVYARFGSASGQGITNNFDGFGRQTQATTTMGGVSRSLSYQHDLNNNRTRVTHPDGNYFTYTYDDLDRAKQILENGSTTLLAQTFDNQGRSKQVDRLGGASTKFDYDPISRLASFEHDLSGTADDLNNIFAYNPAGQMTSRMVNNGKYIYSGNQNITGSYAVNGLNQYTSAGLKTFSYDAKGNLASDGSTTYTFDIENRLLSASGANNATLKYDPLGRLYETTSGGVTTYFLYDGEALVAEYNGSGTLTQRYVHGSNADEPLVWYEGSTVTSSTRRFLHGDHQRSVIGVSNSSAGLTAVNAYDVYGIPAVTNTGRFGYTGQTWISGLELYYYKARFYSPTLGRFLQTDPIGYEDQMNLYAYVGNDPMNMQDPSGEYGRGSGFTDEEWKRFNRIQKAAANKMNRKAAKFEKKAAKRDAKGKSGGAELRQKASNLRGGAEVLNSDGSDGKVANAVSAAEYQRQGGSADGAAFVRANGPVMVVNIGNRNAWNSGDQMTAWVVGHESLHTAGLNDQRDTFENLAYKYGSRAHRKAYTNLKGTPKALINPDHLMELVY